MVFSTHLFIFYFLPLTLLIYYALPRGRLRSLFLASMSYIFYAWANPPWALIMFFSTLQDYLCGVFLFKLSGLPMDGDQYRMLPKDGPRSRGQKVALAVSLVGNLLLLGFFKYYDFTAENLNRISDAFGMRPEGVPLLHIALPVGISFYTFQSMSYAIDVYRSEARPMRSLFDFMCFEALYPQLVAGPIVRYWSVAEQMRHRVHSWERFARGVAFFSLGMAKKVILANPMGHVADRVFAVEGMHGVDAWYGLFAYAFQIYFDFSAYSDMAVGLGMMHGFLFTKNFDDPYLADSITDFWRRWHISLSTWLRDYLYVPLGGNRRGAFRTYGNLMIVMLLGGLWHGASWNFIIWGAIHGSMLAFERFQGKDSPYRNLPRPLRVAVTFIIVCLGWVFFRAETLPQAARFVATLFGFGAHAARADLVAGSIYTPYHIGMFCLCAIAVWGLPQAWQFTQRLTPARAVMCMSLLLVSLLFMWTQTVNPFLYFQF